MPPIKTASLSYSSIFKVVIVLLSLFLAYLLREVVALIFIAIVFAAALDPFVDYFEKNKIPRAVSIIVIYLIILAIFSLVIVLLIPPVSEQVGQLAKSLPGYYERVMVGVSQIQDGSDAPSSLPDALKNLSNNLGETTKGVFTTLTGIFGGIMSLLSLLVIVFYLVVEENGLKHFMDFLTPGKHRQYISHLIDKMQTRVGLWLRGQLILMLIIGVMTYIGLNIMGVKYSLLLALIAGLTEIIPFVGPFIGAIPAIFIAISDSWLKAILVGVLYIFIQQLENQILVPKIMQKTTGLNPIVVIVAILIGAKLGGAVGALLSVPVAAMINVFLADLMPERFEDGEKS